MEMADNIVLKTYKGGTVTPQNDAIIHETAIPSNGIFKGCNVSYARGNILRVSSGFGMIKGRFFEIYECEVDVQLVEGAGALQGRLYVHMDLSNVDEPIQLLTQTADVLPELAADSDVNYNNSAYDLELAVFRVTSSEISRLEMTFQKIESGSGGGGGGKENILRATEYQVGDMTRCVQAPGWVTLVCVQAGETALTVPSGYAGITRVGDEVVDGTCVFEARDIIGELTEMQSDIDAVDRKVDESVTTLNQSIGDMADEVVRQLTSAGNIVQKLMSITDYEALATYDSNTMYFCYASDDDREIKRIYLGEHIIFANGVSVTYQIDTGSSISQVSSLSVDIVVTAPPATKKGYTFVGWRTDNQPDSEVLENYVLKNENPVTLYAVFQKATTITRDSLDAVEPEGTEEWSVETTLYYNNGNSLTDAVKMPDCPYTMEGKTFCGWTVDSSVHIGEYVNGESYKFDREVILFPTFVDTEYDFLAKGSNYQVFRFPADGIYEFELWGGAGGDASGSVTINGTQETLTAKGGKGGHVKAYKKMRKDETIYFYYGGKANGTGGGSNGGTNGNTYNSSGSTGKHYGAGSGGSTFVTDQQFIIANSNSQSTNYNNRNHILLLAAGGGGAGISGATIENSYNPDYNCVIGAHPGGDAGGERGQDGSGDSLGGRQVAVGTTDYVNFGYCPTPSSSGMTFSGGGSGWFAGEYGCYGNSGAGGSSYIGNMPTFIENGVKYKALNEGGVNEGHGYGYIRYVCPCKID